MLPSVNRALHSSAEAMPLAALGSQLDQPWATTIHSGPPASLSRTSKRYIFVHGRPDKALWASSQHSSQLSRSPSAPPMQTCLLTDRPSADTAASCPDATHSTSSASLF